MKGGEWGAGQGLLKDHRVLWKNQEDFTVTHLKTWLLI